MLASSILVLSLAGLPVYAQSSSSSSSSSSSVTTTTSISTASSASGSGSSSSGISVSGSGTTTSNHTSSNTQATALTFTLAVTNPTAIPLASITANETSLPTIPLPSTATPGATNTFLSGAPALPNPTSILPANYPPMDKVPPTDSAEVQQWIAEVAASGIEIPNLTATLPGGCPANLAAAQDTSRCWWYCTGCVRDTDVQECPTKLTWGLTYDDGPSYYTPNLLTYLTANELHATFFTVGSRCLEFPATLQEEFMSGHQIAVHTWSHPYLTTLTNEQIIAELGWTKKIMKDVTGVTPNMMRPPFGDIDDRVRNISIAMGLTPVMWTRMSATATFDTDDFDVHGGLASSYGVLNNWENIIANASTIDTGFIVLEHDLFEESVNLATGYILPSALHQNFTIKPVVECLNKPMTDAYIETNNNLTNPPAASGAVTLSSGAPGSISTSSSASKNSGAALKISGTSSALALGGVVALVAFFI